MESLAYIHLALAYEVNPDNGCVSLLKDVKLFEGLNRKKLSSRSWIYMLSLAIALGVLSIASSALAELQTGDRGTEVTALQQRLRQLGYFDGRITGNFDPATTAAVIRFQKAKGLSQDGIVGEQTQDALFAQRRRKIAVRRSAPRMAQTGSSDSPNRPNRKVAISTGSSSPEQTESNNSPKETTVNVTARRSVLRIVQVQPSSNNLPDQSTQKIALRSSETSFLQPGDRGTEVRNLQQSLKQAGLYQGRIDGVFSPATETAVRQFQQDNKLTVDGLAGPRTLAILQRVGSQEAVNQSPKRVASSREIFRRRVGSQETANQAPKRVASSPSVQPERTKPAIESLQVRLKQLGYYNSDITGYLNSQTRQAVIQFQRDQGLEADGIPGRITLSALEKATGIESVQSLQRRLQDNGFYKGPINGVLGSQTKAAIAAAQQAYGISSTDITNRGF
jgi:peptidoglycan hydrolase-like protein with peptidoglycan-binding domain